MAVDWRRLFDGLGVTWTDKGRNARRGNVSIQCPFCGDEDPSQHMLVSESNRGWYCLRNPQRHRGRDYIPLMQRLLPEQGRRQVIALLNQYNTLEAVAEYKSVRAEPSEIEAKWSRFRPAYDSQRCVDYLGKRGFPEPETVCRQYDLRYAPVGQWAMRLLIPITDAAGTVVSWTGRAMRDDLTLRYDMPPTGNDALYVPGPMKAVGLVVEGPMDALKAAVAANRLPIAPVAVLGLGFNEARARQLSTLSLQCHSMYLCLDASVDPVASNLRRGRYGIAAPAGPHRAIMAALAGRRHLLYIERLRLPRGYDDLGEMPVPELTELLRSCIRDHT